VDNGGDGGWLARELKHFLSRNVKAEILSMPVTVRMSMPTQRHFLDAYSIKEKIWERAGKKSQ